MVNGMIVDGLGHVSLDSGTAAAVAAAQPQQTATNLSQQQQPNIHQGNGSVDPRELRVKTPSRKRSRREREEEEKEVVEEEVIYEAVFLTDPLQ